MTSQPSLGAVVGALQGTQFDTNLNLHQLRSTWAVPLGFSRPQTHHPLSLPSLSAVNDYWEEARGLYAPFESGQKSGSADVYQHEMPGGQYTNLLFQSQQLGLSGRWPAIKKAYVR